LGHIGHPVVGDRVYRQRGAAPGGPDLIRRVEGLGGLALHAAVLGFTHPGTGEQLRFEAPPPAPFQALLAWLGARDDSAKMAGESQGSGTVEAMGDGGWWPSGAAPGSPWCSPPSSGTWEPGCRTSPPWSPSPTTAAARGGSGRS